MILPRAPTHPPTIDSAALAEQNSRRIDVGMRAGAEVRRICDNSNRSGSNTARDVLAADSTSSKPAAAHAQLLSSLLPLCHTCDELDLTGAGYEEEGDVFRTRYEIDTKMEIHRNSAGGLSAWDPHNDITTDGTSDVANVRAHTGLGLAFRTGVCGTGAEATGCTAADGETWVSSSTSSSST